MKLLFCSLSLFISVIAAGQPDISITYNQHDDAPRYGKPFGLFYKSQYRDIRQQKIQHMSEIAIGYKTTDNWYYSVGVSFLIKNYEGSWRGGSWNTSGDSTHGVSTDSKAHVSYSYTGLRLSATRLFGREKCEWYKTAVTVFGHIDCLTHYKATNKQQTTTITDHVNGTTTSSTIPWHDEDFAVYKMTGLMTYFGVSAGPRFTIGKVYIQTSLTLGMTWNYRYRKETMAGYPHFEQYDVAYFPNSEKESDGDRVYKEPYVFAEFAIRVGYELGKGVSHNRYHRHH